MQIYINLFGVNIIEADYCQCLLFVYSSVTHTYIYALRLVFLQT